LSISAALGAVPRTGLSASEPFSLFREVRGADALEERDLREAGALPELDFWRVDGRAEVDLRGLDDLSDLDFREPDDEDRPSDLRLSAIPTATIAPARVPRATRSEARVQLRDAIG
jgi:hypothetical protein